MTDLFILPPPMSNRDRRVANMEQAARALLDDIGCIEQDHDIAVIWQNATSAEEVRATLKVDFDFSDEALDRFIRTVEEQGLPAIYDAFDVLIDDFEAEWGHAAIAPIH